MARYYNKRKREDEDDLRAVFAVFLFYCLYLFYLWFVNRENFWRWLAYGLGVIILIIVAKILYVKIRRRAKDKKIVKMVNVIKAANLEKYINDFISNYGLGKQERKENSWIYRNYSIAWYRIDDLSKFLKERGIIFSNQEICFLLKKYIEERDFKMLKTSSIGNYHFKNLSGADFEKLLYRLYEAMGYNVQLTGGRGDQGGDLIVSKEGNRIVVQAKCYQNLVNNKAIQEAVAAKGIYNCNSSTVVTTSDFTDGALELAKVNYVYLINGKKLKELLLYYFKENWN
jgi:restriction system protein